MISQIINKEQQNRNQKLSQIQFGQFMREFAKHQQKNQSQSPDTTDISALQKQIKKYLATEEQTNKEYANRQRFINANKKKPKVQITSSNPQKSGSMFGKVAGATGTLLALSYFA